jgi:putative ubiquitin-RnfH superfamily antitoxin RatB of RatAB toxin-antitoxin module
MREPGTLAIEVVCALPAVTLRAEFALAAGVCVGDALRAAAALPEFAQLDLPQAVVGVFGKVARRETLLADGDRVEIYRPLAQDPKIARRNRASRSGRS